MSLVARSSEMIPILSTASDFFVVAICPRRVKDSISSSSTTASRYSSLTMVVVTSSGMVLMFAGGFFVVVASGGILSMLARRLVGESMVVIARTMLV